MPENDTEPGGERIPEINPENDPEYVGAHSSIVAETCQHWRGAAPDDVEACDRAATHTIVEWDGTKLVDIASCDECGNPEDVDSCEEWSGELAVTPHITLTTVDEHPVLVVNGTYVRLRTTVRVESVDNFLGNTRPMEAEKQCDGEEGCWFNVWPANGETTPRVLIQPEMWGFDDA